MYRIILTEPFVKEFSRLFDNTEVEKFIKFKEKLKSNPYIGRRLRVPFVREFKTQKGKRAYFIVYDEFKLVLFVATSNKKNQIDKINEIFNKLETFYNLASKYYTS